MTWPKGTGAGKIVNRLLAVHELELLLLLVLFLLLLSCVRCFRST